MTGPPLNTSPSCRPDGGALAYLRELAATLSDRGTYRCPYGEVFFFNHPDDVRAILQSQNFVRTPLVTVLLGQGLLASDGGHWKQQRKLAQPAFREPCVHAFLPVVSRCTSALLQRWEDLARHETVVDAGAEMRRLNLDVILQCLFSTHLGEDLTKVDKTLTVIIEDLGSLAGTFFNQHHVFTPNRNARLQAALKEFDELVYGILREYSAGDESHSLMALLAKGRDAVTGEPLTQKQIRDEIVTMILGGHETTASILTWTWHLLASHPHIERKLVEELETHLQGRAPVHADLSRLPYCRMVFQESMRLYPPVWFMMRKALATATIGGLEIPAGGSVLISPYTLHRHPEYWEEADSFNPERFEEGIHAHRHKYSFLPFSAGRHQCLGMGFAMMEGPLMLAALAQRFRILPTASTRVEAAPLLTLRQKGGLPCRLLPRTAPATPPPFTGTPASLDS